MALYEYIKLAGCEDISFDDLYLLLSIKEEDLNPEMYSGPAFHRKRPVLQTQMSVFHVATLVQYYRRCE